MNFVCHFVAVLLSVSALQFTHVTNTISAGGMTYSLAPYGVDFTVYAAIDVFALGMFDADERGFMGAISVLIVDRSNDRVVAGPVLFNNTVMRTDDLNPFAFVNLSSSVRIEPGVYCITSIGFNLDRFVSTTNVGGSVLAGENGDGAVLATSVLANGLTAQFRPSLFTNSYLGELMAGATFLFTLAPKPISTEQPPSRDFVDCEAVACAGLVSGEYKIQGRSRYCDSDSAGGGWMRLWRANESTCEASGWTSGRNPYVSGVDPFGCILARESCVGSRANAPFAFNEVRGGNWRVWAAGAPDAFQSRLVSDGIVVRDGNNSLVWVLAAGHSSSNFTSRCPCEAAFVNSTLSSANLDTVNRHWTCDRLPTEPTNSLSWVPLFQVGSRLQCRGDETQRGDVEWFLRKLDSPQTALVVSICKEASINNKDLKLSGGDLFVRATVGFDKSKHCATSTTSSTTTLSTTTSNITITTAAVASESGPFSVADNAPEVGSTVWILSTAVIILALILCATIAVAFYFIKRSGSVANQQRTNAPELTTARDSQSSQREYQAVPVMAKYESGDLHVTDELS